MQKNAEIRFGEPSDGESTLEGIGTLHISRAELISLTQVSRAVAIRPPRREALATPERTLPDFGSGDDHHQTEIVARPLILRGNDDFAEPRYTLRGEFEYGGLTDVHLAFLEGAGGFRRAVVVQRLASPDGVPALPPDALLGCHTRHPNVIPALDVIQSRGEHLLVLEYVISATLSRLLSQGNRPPLPISSAIVSGVLHALHAAHSAVDELDTPLEIVHGSVTPHNVLVGVDGTPRLIHFGQDRRGRVAHATRVKLAYISPEQVFDQRADARSDVFAAGLLLWECLSGRPLLEGGSAVDSMLRFISQPVPPASAINPGVPKALDAVLARALEPTPERRFQSALAFAAELEDLIEPASREDVARYVEGVAWSPIHEQRLLLRGPEDEPPLPLPVSQLWERSSREAASGPRTSAAPRASVSSDEDPTLARGFIYSSGLNELKTDWKTREPDEHTKVEGIRTATPPPAPPTPAPIIEPEDTDVDLSPAPLPRLPHDSLGDADVPAFRGDGRNLVRLVWAALAVAGLALLIAMARTPIGAALFAEARELGARVTGKPRSSTPAPTTAKVAAPAARATNAAAASALPEPPQAPSVRVLTLEELPVVGAGEPSEVSKRETKNKRRKRAH